MSKGDKSTRRPGLIAVLLGLALAAVPLAAAGEGAGRPDTRIQGPDAPTELGKMTVEEAPGSASARALARLRRDLGCLDCIAVDHRELAPWLQLSIDIGGALARQILPQPRVRGEPMDEALYYVLQDCVPDHVTCMGRHPNRALYNWAPDANQPLDADPVASTR